MTDLSKLSLPLTDAHADVHPGRRLTIYATDTPDGYRNRVDLPWNEALTLAALIMGARAGTSHQNLQGLSQPTP